MNFVPKGLQDPRIYTSNNPKRNMLLDAALNRDQPLLIEAVSNAIKLEQEKSIGVVINLAPSYEVANFINDSVNQLFKSDGFASYIFAIPILVVADENKIPSVLAQEQINLLLTMLAEYGVFYVHPDLLQDLSQASLHNIYNTQYKTAVEIGDGAELIKVAIQGDSSKISAGFIHQTANSVLTVRYLIGISSSNKIFAPEAFAQLGMVIMQGLINQASPEQLYIPCFISTIVQAVNDARFFFIESVFNIEVSDTVKSIRMSNDSICYATISTSNNEHEGSIILKLYKRSLALVANSKGNNDFLIKELTWPLTVVDNFTLIADRISGLLSAMQIEIKPSVNYS